MHHALLGGDILGVGSHIDNNRFVLWQRSLEVSFLPLKFFELVVLIIVNLLLLVG